MPSASVRITTATTTTIVPAPSSGSISVIAFDITATDTNGSIELMSGSTRMHGLLLPADGVGGISKGGGDPSLTPLFKCDANTALTAVSSASGTMYVNVTYVIV